MQPGGRAPGMKSYVTRKRAPTEAREGANEDRGRGESGERESEREIGPSESVSLFQWRRGCGPGKRTNEPTRDGRTRA